MKTIALRHLAEINPPCPRFERLPHDSEVLFLPLETVWSDDRADQTRRATKRSVESGYTRFQAGDTVCPKVTPTFQAGRSMRANAIGAGTTELHVLRPRAGVDPRWITYAVRSKHFLDEGVTAFQGVAGLQRVPTEFIAHFGVVDVPEQEQQRIADFLDDRVACIDQIITARHAQEQALREARFAQLGQSLGASGPRRRLSHSLALGAVGVVVKPSSYFTETGVPFVHGYNVRDGVFDLTDLKRMSPGDSIALGRSRLRKGDVLVVRAGYPGRAAVVTAELAGGNCASVLLLRPGPSLAPGWLSAFFNSPIGRAQIEAQQYGAAQEVINLSDVMAFSIPLPHRDVQERILRELRSSEARWGQGLALLASEASRLSELKQSLITAAVTGELDVTTSGSGIPG